MLFAAVVRTITFAMEKRAPHNNDHCLTNSIFACLLAGILAGIRAWLPQASAQRWLDADRGHAALTVDFCNRATVEAKLDAGLISSARRS